MMRVLKHEVCIFAMAFRRLLRMKVRATDGQSGTRIPDTMNRTSQAKATTVG